MLLTLVLLMYLDNSMAAIFLTRPHVLKVVERLPTPQNTPMQSTKVARFNPF